MFCPESCLFGIEPYLIPGLSTACHLSMWYNTMLPGDSGRRGRELHLEKKDLSLSNGEWELSFNEMCAEIWNLHLMKGPGVIDSVEEGKENWPPFLNFPRAYSEQGRKEPDFDCLHILPVKYFTHNPWESFKTADGWKKKHQCLHLLFEVWWF